MVSVPVLSSTKAVTLRICSSAAASLMRMFCSAALPMPTIKAVGVASPIAQGQAMTSTATAEMIACCKPPPQSIQTKKVSNDNAATTGTKIMAKRSTTR